MKRNKLLKIGAWSLAGVALVGALAYYNFIDQAPIAKVVVGETCPDFTAQVLKTEDGAFYASEETFTLSEYRGKVCVVNFWEVWCSGCIQELPEFDEFYKKYSDRVEVVAVCGGVSVTELGEVVTWLNERGWTEYDADGEWKDFSITLAYPKTSYNLYTELGGKGGLPRTVIVDQSGTVVYESGKMSYKGLENVILPLLEE